MAVIPFSEEMRKHLTSQGYRWVRNSQDLGEIEKLALCYYDTQIMLNRATKTYSLYVFGRKIAKPMFGKFEVAGVLVQEGDVEVIPKEGPTMHFKDITAFEDEKVERFAEAEETIAEEVIERDVPPEEWENYGIGPEVVERVREKRKKKTRERTLIGFGLIEPPEYVKEKGKKRKTLFAFGEKSIDVRGVPTDELEESVKTGLFQGFELKPEDVEIIKEEIRRRKEEDLEVDLGILKRERSETACPKCSEELETMERWWAHLKIHHPKIYEALKAEERAERRRKAKERAKKIPEDAKFIARKLKIDVFTGNSILNKILAQNQDYQVVDWEAIAERNWKELYDRDEYLNQIEERVKRYGIDLHPVEAVKKAELEEMQEEFETEQLENILEEYYIEGENAERVDYLKASAETLIKMAQRGSSKAKVALVDFLPDIPMEKYLRPEELKGRKGPPKLSPKDIKIDREIAKQLDDKTLEEILKRRKVLGRLLLKKEAEIFAEELEMRRLERGVQDERLRKAEEEGYRDAKGYLDAGQTIEKQELRGDDRVAIAYWKGWNKAIEGRPLPSVSPERERQIAEAKALIAPMMTSQLEEMLETGVAFGGKLEPWAIEIINAELKAREEKVISTLHGVDYPNIVRGIAEARTLSELDEIMRHIASRTYDLTPADEIELQTMVIEKRAKREAELQRIEERRKPPEKPPKKPKKEPEVAGYPKPFIEMDACTTCGVTAPNLDFDSRALLSELLGLPIHLLDACQRCVIGVYNYADIITYITEAIESPRRYGLMRSDLDWLRKVERTILESDMATMFAVDVNTAYVLGTWLYKHFKGEVLSIGMSNVFVTHRGEIVQAFGEQVANELGAAKIGAAMLVGRWLARQPLKPPRKAMDEVAQFLFTKFMIDWVEYGFDFILQRHNVTTCNTLSRYGFRVQATSEVEFGRPRCTIPDDMRDALMESIINITPEFTEGEESE